MSFTEVFAHFVWSTKYRQPVLIKPRRDVLFEHIKQNAKKNNIHIDSIGGYTDHMHTLISLSRELSLSKTAQLIKGESSYWVNRTGLFKSKFEWQDEYYAVSVSPDRIQRVRDYILNQEAHHTKKSFEQEIQQLLARGMKAGH